MSTLEYFSFRTRKTGLVVGAITAFAGRDVPSAEALLTQMRREQFSDVEAGLVATQMGVVWDKVNDNHRFKGLTEDGQSRRMIIHGVHDGFVVKVASEDPHYLSGQLAELEKLADDLTVILGERTTMCVKDAREQLALKPSTTLLPA